MFDLMGRDRMGSFPESGSSCRLITEVGIEVDGVALREAVDERHRAAETQAQQAADDLPSPGAFGHQVKDAPADADHPEQEKQIASPLNGLAHAVTERLVVASEDGTAGRLRE